MKKQLYFLLTGFILFCLGTGTLLGNDGSPQILKEWKFDTTSDLSVISWNHLTKPTLSHGSLNAEMTSWDPFFVFGGIEIKPQPGQYIEFRMKSNGVGDGEFYYASSNEGQYGGFVPQKVQHWAINHDGQWHTYRIYPIWRTEPRIIKIRLDFGNPGVKPAKNIRVEIDHLKIVDPQFNKARPMVPSWSEEELKKDWTTVKTDQSITMTSKIGVFDAFEFGSWISIDLKRKSNSSVQKEQQAILRLWGSKTDGAAEIKFPIQNDNFVYNFNIGNEPWWNGQFYQLELVLPSNDIVVQQLRVSEEPFGPGKIDINYQGMTNALNRTEVPVDYLIRMKNIGGTTFKNLHFDLVLDDRIEKVKYVGANINDTTKCENRNLPDIEPFIPIDLNLTFQCTEPGQHTIRLDLKDKSQSDKIIATIPIKLDITPSLHLPKASYVPKPIPVKSKYQLGALYFPGWSKREAWDRIKVSEPIRKPVLGWYDEGNPEVVDWQIKWATETGIQFFLVDWYWNRGSQHLDHWVKAFQQAKYRSYMKWAMMWANHNGPGSHSVEDMTVVTKFWIDNYFNTPEYYRIDDKPVVMIWSPEGMDNDVIAIERKKGNMLKKGEGVKILLDRSRKMAQEAGYKGIYFVAMKWPESSPNADIVQGLKDGGFDCTSLYHFMHHGNKAENPRKFRFDLVVDATSTFLEARQEAGILPFFPNLSSGWDSRPWHGDRQTIIYDRTPEKFGKICRIIKDFVDRTGMQPIVTAPVNEWGEGSYIEPNLEFGFDMYEQIRETFCEKPTEGFPPYYGPTDVGLGPYDLPPIVKATFNGCWSFSDKEKSAWQPLMGINNFQIKDNRIIFQTTNKDPAIQTGFEQIKAKNWTQLIIRMKIKTAKQTKDGLVSQIFWVPTFGEASENGSLSLPIINDGQFHNYIFELNKVKSWHGLVSGFRFDPLNQSDATVEIESIQMKNQQ